MHIPKPSALVNEFSVLLDTCTIVPISLCDLLLRLAESPAWSSEIPEELRRTLERPPFSLAQGKAAYRIACMQSSFPEALVAGYESLTESMPNHSKARHVLAAAVFSKADAIVTLNKRDFPLGCLSAYGVERLTPDEFLVHQWHLDPRLVHSRVAEQAIACKKEMAGHLALLERMVPRFVALVRSESSR